ncbi:MAG: hypothetical protein LLG16_03460 [Euryarchaeota archaeon]|nr:hypothetical protein [Euryarchaeota archaeon]
MWPKRGKPRRKVEYVETCPQCMSRKVTHHFGFSAYTFMGILYVYECPDCGYKGINVGLSPLDEVVARESAGTVR